MRTHKEKHFTATDFFRDVIIGISDGLTVPFALAAGLSGAVSSSGVVVTAGVAEIAAGCISMGLGGYLAAKSEAEHYFAERRREHREVKEIPEQEKKEVADIFKQYGLDDQEIAPILHKMEKSPKDWVNFMMRFELALEEPDPRRALTSAVTIGAAYAGGGIIPLAPYMAIKENSGALFWSCVITLVALFVFGFVRGKFTGVPAIRTAVQTVLVGGLAAGVAFGIARLVSH